MPTFVGRAPELQKLRARWQAALQGRGGVLLVSGEAGAGKSTLVQQFLSELPASAAGARLVRAGCSEQYGADEPYQPFVEAFRELVSTGESRGRRSFRELAREVAPYWLQAIPVAGGLLAAATSTAVELKRTFGGGGAAAPPNEEALFFQYTELFLTAAREAPLVLFIDDLHWADRASISLLAHLARKVADQQVLILGTYRGADVEVAKHPLKQAKLELERYGVAEELVLGALDGPALTAWVEAELGGPAEPALARWLEQRAGSNPLFFGELLKWVVEQGIARRKGDEWLLGELPAEIDIPRSAESVIEKRLGRLDPEVYRILEYASVEGDTFNSVVLARLLDMDELALEEALEPIARTHRLIRLADTRDLPNGDIASVYDFAHSLIQDVLHKAIQGKRRILLHRKVAEVLEQAYAGETAPIAARLAVHYDEGRLPERAYAFSMTAAELARRVYAHQDAIDLLQRALRNARKDEERLEAEARIGEQNRRIGHFPAALAAFEEALALAETAGALSRALSLRRQMLEVECDCGARPLVQLQAALDQLSEEAQRLDAPAEICEILWQYRRIPGAGEQAIERARSALEIAADAAPELAARAYQELGTAHLVFGHPAEAGPLFEQALARFEAQGDKLQIGNCQNHLAISRILCGDYAAAARSFAAAVQAYETAGDPMASASVRNNLGTLLIRLGEWDRAEPNLLQSIRVARRLEAGTRLLHPLENLARLYHARGEWSRAVEQWEQLLHLATSLGHWMSEAIAHCGIGLARLEEGDLAGARSRCAQAAELLEDHPAWSESRTVHRLLAIRIATHEGRLGDALSLLDEAEPELVRRDAYTWAQFRVERGRVLLRTDPVAAGAVLADARSTLDRLGAQPLRQHAESLLSKLESAA